MFTSKMAIKLASRITRATSLAGVLVVAAYASHATAQTAVNEAARAMLPAEIRDRGYITAAVDPSFGPVGIFVTKENPDVLIGLSADLLNGAAEVLGIEVKYDVVALAGIIPGLTTGRWDMGGNAITDTIEREEVVDMLDLYRASSVLMVAKGNPHGITSVDDICGKDVAMNEGTAQLVYLQKYSEEKCQTPINFVLLKSRAEVFLAIRTGRAVAHLISAKSAAGNLSPEFNPENAGLFEAVIPKGDKIAPSFEGFAFAKDKTELRDAVGAAIQVMIDDGSYSAILEKWSMAGSEIDAPIVNGVGAGAL